MEDCFCDLASSVRLILLTDSTDYTELKRCLNEFEKQCKKLESFELAAFTNLHYEELTKVVFCVRRLSVSDSQLRAYHDRIFKNVLSMSNHVPRNITRMFDDFIRGITYFEYENPAQEPVYHRLASCGSGTAAFRKLHQQCTSTMDKMRKNEIKQKIEKCYIERLIYDKIYKENELAFDSNVSQDVGHMHRMDETHNDFKSCFPNVSIHIDIVFEAQLPIKLSIIKTVGNRVIVHEEYTKEVELEPLYGGKKYSSFVHCKKITPNAEYARVQTFGGQLRSWKKVIK